jgi:CheY-like chemotaxis protein
MIVDDDPSVLVALSRVLRREHDVIAAGSADEALAHIRGGAHFDAIILDVVMPGMTGIELYEVLEREAPSAAEAVAFVTAGGFTADSERFLRNMGSRCFEKPVDLTTLRRFVESRVAIAKT